MQLLNNDDIDELDSIDHRVTSSDRTEYLAKTPDHLKKSLEGLSECEVRVLMQDEFIPATINHHRKSTRTRKMPAGESNVSFAAAATNPSASEGPLKLHDGALAAMAANVPIAPTMNLTTADQLIRQTEVAATSGDLFMTGN